MSEVIKGEADLHARLVALQKMGKPIMGVVGLAAVREQKLSVPRKTGNLGRSIHLGPITTKSVDTIASASYAGDVEFGTKPHIIRPRTKKALRFPAGGSATLSGRVRSGGTAVFARLVRHPGTRPQPFMVPGAQRALIKAKLKDVAINVWNGAA